MPVKIVSFSDFSQMDETNSQPVNEFSFRLLVYLNNHIPEFVLLIFFWFL